MKKIIPIGFGLLIIIWLSILTFVFVSHKNQVTNQIAILEKSEADNSNTEIIKLKAQIQQIVDYNDDFLSTIIWSLSFSSTFLLVFLGLIGYFTNRRYEQDKESLENKLYTASKEIEANTQTQITIFKGETQSEILELADKLKTEIKTIADKSATDISSPIKNQLTQMHQEFLMLKVEFLLNKANESERNKIYGNALANHFEIARIGVKIGHNFRVSNALEEIVRLLNLPSSFRNADEVREVTEFLQKLPAEYETLVSRVKAKL